MKKIIAILLCVVMILSVAPLSLLADLSFEPDKLDPTMKLTSKTDFALAPGITESAIITHNIDGSNQVKSWAVEVDLSVPSTQILASYKDYMSNLGPAAWGMQTVRDQAAKAETYYQTYAPQPDPNFRVVAGVNGDFFNMGNGAPTGTFVMNTKVYNVNEGWPYFAIMKDGTAKIGQGDLDLDEAKEVVGGPASSSRTARSPTWDLTAATASIRCRVPPSASRPTARSCCWWLTAVRRPSPTVRPGR